MSRGCHDAAGSPAAGGAQLCVQARREAQTRVVSATAVWRRRVGRATTFASLLRHAPTVHVVARRPAGIVWRATTRTAEGHSSSLAQASLPALRQHLSPRAQQPDRL